MTRVMFVIATLDPAGAERQLAHLATELDRERFLPFVCCLTRGGELLERKLRAAGVACRVLGKAFKLDFRVVCKLVRVMREFRPDIVHTWLFTANAFGRAAAVLAKAPHVIASERNVDDWRTWLHRAIDRRLARRSDLILANAEAVRAFCVAEGIPSWKIRVIPNGIDIGPFGMTRDEGARQAWGSGRGDFVVGALARLSEQKGIDVLIEAFRLVSGEIANARLVIVGEGELEDRLRRQAVDAGIGERVCFDGFRPDVARVLAGFDCFVLPSRWEGLPNVVMEAMAARCPVVATDVGGTRELVRHGETGRLVPVDDSRALSAAIVEVFRCRDLSVSMAERARALIEREYGARRMIEATAAAYTEVAAT